MRILVTGGAGFLGKATVEAGLSAGHDMVVFDRSVGLDVTRYKQVRAEILDHVDHVIHLAGVLGTAELFDDPHGAVDANVHGAVNVLEACREAGAGYTAVTMPSVFPSIYTATKVCADRLATAYHHAHGLDTSHVCAFNAYGPGQKYGGNHPQKIIPTFATLAWQGKPLPVWGDGQQGVDLVHVDDIGRMLVAATGYGSDETFDAGTGVMLTVNQVAQTVMEMVATSGGPPDQHIEYLPMRKGETPTEIVAEGRGWDLLGWKPSHTYHRLYDTVLSYRESAEAAA
jgi:UDP-glucose 4-epimerase